MVPRPGWGGEPHSGSDSPGIARLPTCAQRLWEREYAPPDPLAAIPRPGLPLQGRGVLHPPSPRGKPGNPRIFRMPLETRGRGRRGRQEKAGKGAQAED